MICFFFMTCAGIFTAEPLRSLRRTDEPLKGRNSCLRLRPRSVFSSLGVVLMSCKVNFHVVRSALQNSVCLSIILMLGIMTQKIQRQIKRKYFICWLIINYPIPTSIQGIPLFRGHLPWSRGCPLNRGCNVWSYRGSINI